MGELPATSAETVSSRISRKWTVKMVLIALGLIAFGLWGLYDATVAYPRRGSRASEFLELQYMQQYSQLRPPLDRRAGIDDPRAELTRLRLKEQTSGGDSVDRACLQWLESLKLIGRLDASTATTIPRTDFRGDMVPDANLRFKDLTTKFTSSQGGKIEAPSPLSPWDIPVQWLITVAGLGTGAWIVLLILRVRARSFSFEPASMRLTLPGGASIVPADIEDFDKRRWHKFYVTLRIKPSHAQLGGRAVELDLLRYEPVEEWVLAMERAAFPDRAESENEPDEPAGEEAVTSPPGPLV
ncbi:hypothetical protein PHYC_03303 [Phycisphaerales bacterium]|nr:hypothetical protein PHYC_03303 [Phycisphaerales bacterium]